MAKRTVLITGCSNDSLGAALAIAFKQAGLKVYATGRNLAKLSQVQDAGIETLSLDVLSESSITACVSKVPQLDILVNNAGAGYSTAISDMSIPTAKELFDLNVWSCIAVTQAFLPLLLESRGMVVNHTSAASVSPTPFGSVYSASKAAMAMFSDALRFEMEPFNVKVVELKTGAVQSNFVASNQEQQAHVPEKSIYAPVKELVEKSMRGGEMTKGAPTSSEWATGVVRDVLKPSPPPIVWRGSNAFLASLAFLFPRWLFSRVLKQMTGMDDIIGALSAK